MRLGFTIFLTAAALLAVAPPVAAQAGGITGGITGTVLDQTGGPLPGVTIDLTAGATEQTTVTRENGTYRFDQVPSGPAELTFRLINFTVIRRAVSVADTDVPANVVMTLSFSADVIVTGSVAFRNIDEVANPSENLLGIASAASHGALTAEQLEARPMMRTGELFETVPGMIVSQHSGEGKANQYYLRGFNLDHGTDFSMTVAGVPVNTPTGAHAHGYADVGFLIPELVSGVQYKKGPYYADEGDFSAAGAAHVNYVNRLDRPLVRLSGGHDRWGRFFGAASPGFAGGHLLAALELNHSDGPWERPDDYQKRNALLRFSRGDTQNGFSITGSGYWADWDSTDQVPRRAVTSGMISRFGLVDSTDRGYASRQTLTADLQRSFGRSSVRATAFVLRNRLDLFSNFTYFLEDQENGDQFEQTERRVAAGGRVVYRRLGRLFDRPAESAVGLQMRHDRLAPVGLYHTANRRRLATTREDRVRQTQVGIYANTELEWTRALRTTFGVRTDVYAFDVSSKNPLNSGDGVDARMSPKFTAVFGPWAATEFYANAGMGFHSNDARGAVMRVDPLTGEPAGRVTPLVGATGAELGIRTVRVHGLQSSLSLWYLGLDSELLFVGDAGTTEAGRPSRRYGVEWANYMRITPWLTADADVSFSRARFVDTDPVGRLIPGALDRVVSGGLTVEPRVPIFGSIRLRHFGPRPLVEDASVTSAATTLWNGEIGYSLSDKARVVMEVFNLLDAKVADIDYFYASRLPGEPDAGIEDVHTHPALPRSLRVTFQLSF